MSGLPPLGELPNGIVDPPAPPRPRTRRFIERLWDGEWSTEIYTSDQHDLPEPPIDESVAFSPMFDGWFVRGPFEWTELAPDDPRIEANQ